MNTKQQIIDLSKHYYQSYSSQNENTLKHKHRVIDSFISILPDEIETIDYATIKNWQDSLNQKKSVNTINTYLITLRQFLTVLNKSGIKTEFPILMKRNNDYLPYLFTNDEIIKLITTADNNISYSRHASSKSFCVPMILRLLAYCGLREKEALSIKMSDYDFENGILLLKNTKGRKERYIPLHSSLVVLFNTYLYRIKELFPHTDYAFPNDSGKQHINKGEFSYEFEKIKKIANMDIQRINHERTNCIHCLRHSFTVLSYQKLKKCEIDMLPVLSAYLGHKGILETETYLKFSYILNPEDNKMFEKFTNDIWEEIEL